MKDTTLDKVYEDLKHHCHPREDPCTDRGVDFPCDVAVALLSEIEIDSLCREHPHFSNPNWRD